MDYLKVIAKMRQRDVNKHGSVGSGLTVSACGLRRLIYVDAAARFRGARSPARDTAI